MSPSIEATQQLLDQIVARLPQVASAHVFKRFIETHFAPEDNICFTLIDPTKKQHTKNIFVQRADAVDAAFVKKLHEQNSVYNVYVGMNAYSPALSGEVNKDGRTEDNVVAIRNLYADADHDAAKSLSAILSSDDVPSNVTDILQSSPGKYQFIWRVQDMPKSDAKNILKAIAHTFNTDTAVTDVARVLRVPGFKNIKYSEQPVVGIISHSDQTFTHADFRLKCVESDWCVKSEAKKTGHADLDDESPIIEGSRNTALTSILGKARQVLAMDKEQLYEYGLSVNRKRCNPPLPDQEVRTIANSIGGYAVSPTGTAYVGSSQPAVIEAVQAEFKPVRYPKFPDPTWLFKGCSIYDGLVKPICAVNSGRLPEFLMLPAMTAVLNYLGTKVRIAYKNVSPSIFLVSIGRKGRVFKSSSVQDVIVYLRYAGIVDYANAGIRNAEGKTLIWTAGSPEGLGLDVQRTNCKNFMLFYDELGTLSKKAGIEASTLGQTLCTLYESGMFSNTIKSKRDTYTIQPESYCASLIACTTDRNFLSKMAPLIASSDGMDERFFYLYQPEVLPEPGMYTWVNPKDGAAETKKRIDKAVQQGTYSITGDPTALEHLAKVNPRSEHRAEKWALFFAIDQGLDEITDDCIERAVALTKYELEVKKYLAVPEATTREGMLQNEVINHLVRAGGRMAVSAFNKKMHPERHGTSLWNSVYVGLLKNGWIVEQGTGTKGDPKMVILLRAPSEDED
jgi:hypothetical protein